MFKYQMSPSGYKFHDSDKRIKMALGPFGSGKSCFCSVDVLTYICSQAPAPDGVRYSRVGIIRSSYPELAGTTRKSILEVFPSECGTITSVGAPLKGQYIIPLADGTTVNTELNLWALSSPDDCSKILSSNWTFAWINEATGVCAEVFAAVEQRVARFPSESLGGITYGGILMDFNPPERGTWLDEMVRNPPDDALLVKQPPAAFKRIDDQGRIYYEVNPDAENLRNLGSRQEGDPSPEELAQMDPEEYEAYLQMKGMRYYENQINTQLRNGREDVIQNQYCLLDVPVVEGKPVYSNFNIARHVAPGVIEPILFQEIIIGVDQSGIHPAAVILQNQHGKWCILDELTATNEGLENFLYGMLIPLLRSRYSTNPVTAALDPSNTRDGWTATTPRARFEEAGIVAVTEITNSPRIRIQTVEHMLNMEAGGLLVSPSCEILIRGFTNEYRYRRLRSGGSIGSAYTPQPEKNEASHPHDALQYAALLIHMGSQHSEEEISELARKLADSRRALSRVV